MPPTLLILDDDDQVALMVGRVAGTLGYEVSVTTSIDAFLDRFRASRPDEIVLDLRLGRNDGVEVLRFLAAQGCRARITLISGVDGRTLESTKALAAGMGLMVGEALTKPMRAGMLRAALARRDDNGETVTAGLLDSSLANGYLFLEYQPIIACASRELIGLEALVRLQHPTQGRLPPDRFIPVAETDPDLMDRLTMAVAAQAARDWPGLAASGFAGQVSLNLSAHNLRRLDFPERLEAALQAGGVSPDRVKLEVTETAAMTDPLVTLDILVRLRLKGFALAVDDFGTGYSSLAMLRQLPYSELKVDRSFVKDMVTSRDANAIVRAVLALAQSMDLSSVAEGVESDEVLGLLAELGATAAQGYGISRPLGRLAIAAWMEDYRPSAEASSATNGGAT